MHILNYKKYYFIDKFDYTKLKNLNRDICLIWRSKQNQNNVDLIDKIARFCKQKKIKFFLANNFKLAIRLKLDGVYISAHNKDLRCNCYPTTNKFKILGSAHNIYEIQIKKKQKVDELFFSPIFKDNKRKALGLYRLKNMLGLFDGEKIALGGINHINIKLLNLSKFSGFAGIKYFE
tara:strand:+ start:50 stop:580 length:531 start_codon:yes stop_codon:yes gene_type:complete